MKKKLILFILFVLLFTSCTTPNPPIDNETTLALDVTESTTPSANETTAPQESESETNSIPSGELLTEFPPMDYSIGWLEQTIPLYKNPGLEEIEVLEKTKYWYFGIPFDKQRQVPITSLGITTQDVNKIFRIQHITMLDENHVCVIYKVVRDNQTKYVYRVFERVLHEDENIEIWYTTYEGYYLTKSLKYSSFSNFKIGDSLETLNAIEPACWIDDVWSYGGEDDENALYISFPLLLEDGVLHLTFRCENYQEVAKQDDIKSLFLATDIQFYPNGTDAEINGQTLSILKAENRPPLPGEDS